MTTAIYLRRTLGLLVTAALVTAAIDTGVASAAILPSTTTTGVVSSLNPSVVGDVVTFTATVTKTAGGTPSGGTVQFLDAGALLDTLPLVGGTAQYVTSTLSEGSHTITAAFVPDPLDLTSLPSVSSILTQVVNAVPGGGGGGGGVCIPGVTPPTPTPTISAPARVVGPQAVTVHGTAAANDPVDLYQQTAGSSALSKVGSTTASATGGYSFTRNITKQTTFVVRDQGACGAASSANAVTKVALAVGLKLTSPKKGKLRMRATTAPRVANQIARFYRVKKGGTRVLLAKVATGAKGIAHKTIRARSGKRYRVVATVAAPPGNLAGKSRTQSVVIK